MNVTTPERFWKKVMKGNKNDCWPWIGKWKSNFGYGMVGFRGKSEGSHRISYLLTFGEFDETLDVLHKCDNPPCCNPHHLFLGTAQDNVRDAMKKGRWPSTAGENHPRVKLTREQVDFIRREWKPGYGNAAKFARKFNVSDGCIWGIITRKTWKT